MAEFTEYIWQRRIHHGVRYKKRDALFPESVRLGLEFNAALEKREKLDASLLTNAVVLELCDFAKCVARSEAQFLFEILEFNFDLGVDAMSEGQYFNFRKVVHGRAKLMWSRIKNKYNKLKETFALPQLGDEEAPAVSEQQETNRNEAFDVSLLTSGRKNTQSSESQKSDEGDEPFKRRGRPLSKLTHDSFPHCKELGVKLFVQEENAPAEKLHADRLTKGVVMELLRFSRAFCGICSGIVCDLIKLNFGQELSKVVFHARVNRIMERNHHCLKEEDREALRKELFLSRSRDQRKLEKRKNPDRDHQEVGGLPVQGKRRSSQRDFGSNGTETFQDEGLSYTRPVDFEAEMLSDTATEQEKMTSPSCTSEAETFAAAVEETKAEAAEKVLAAAEETQVEEKTSEEMALEVVIKEEEEEVFVSSVQPQIKGSNPQLPKAQGKKLVSTSVSNLFPSEKHQDQNPTTPTQRFWIRRAPRTQQILQSSRVSDRLVSCRAIGLDFNVGAGSRKKLSLQLFTNAVMCEVHRFAMFMQRSLKSFILEILENNFRVQFQDEAQRIYLATLIITKEQFCLSHPARHKAEFLNSPFMVQESLNAVRLEGDFHTGESFGEEQGQLESETSAATEQEDSDSYPFCRKLGLDLWSTERLPVSRKLDLLNLTKGAALEMLNYIRCLCGNARKTVMDILEHNFDLDLRNSKSNDKRMLQKWYSKNRTMMKKYHISEKQKAWLKELIYVRPTSRGRKDPGVGHSTQTPKKKVVKLRSHYGTCEQIGLHLSIGTKPKSRRKLHLGVLTRRLLLEIHQYVTRNSTQYIPALYQILENNFDLSSQSHRKVEFAWEVSSQVLGIAGKVGRKGSYLDKAVELPLERSQVVCKEEPQDNFTELDRCENSDVTFVRELKPVDIEVEIE